jgi:hypothetical protein
MLNNIGFYAKPSGDLMELYMQISKLNFKLPERSGSEMVHEGNRTRGSRETLHACSGEEDIYSGILVTSVRTIIYL